MSEEDTPTSASLSSRRGMHVVLAVLSAFLLQLMGTMNIRKVGLSFLVAATLVVGGCAGERKVEEPAGTGQSAEATSSAPTPTPSPDPTAVQTLTQEQLEAAAGAQICASSARVAPLVTRSWERVIASRGAADHQEMVEAFYDTVEGAGDNDQAGCHGAVELAELAFSASLLQAAVTAEPEAVAEDYVAVADAGNTWLAEILVNDVSFQIP
ncbi:hypothetical protein MF406_06215 [Georgenia sp. TF02-10]|uniref:hypothetical protein n=1 Tax=Georgenia sp. TF02-10 TaxID=2917725 RepID=UPI001FA73B45|nr:hypothetical protein [Georgenia sp. TF02-10]UNX55827.1 hypothetical protein MF406_06215 [Georgenia sp. TF02-10]